MSKTPGKLHDRESKVIRWTCSFPLWLARPSLISLLTLSLAGACAETSEDRKTAQAPVGQGTADASTANEAAPCIPTPGAFSPIYDPSADELWPLYINDHTFVRGPDQRWHLFGITHAEPAVAPKDEREFAHAWSAVMAQATWSKLPNALSADESFGETVLWAPHVISHDGLYWMFYTGGGMDGVSYQMRLATSTDLVTWARRAEDLFVDGFEARDPFVLRVGARWLMYYTATDEPAGGHHVVAYRSSEDLITWSARAIAYSDDATGTGAGPTESPFVVARDEGYYLFVGSSEDYLATRVFFSRDALQFAGPPIAEIEAHASEVVRDLDGREYLSHAGWGQGGVHLAPLAWRCASSQ